MRGLASMIFVGLLATILWLLAGWLQVSLLPSLDGVIAIVTLFWLYFIVTVPWNMYFQAHQVLVEGAVSQQRGISVDPAALAYAARWSRRALWLALGLHLLTAGVLAGIALAGISLIGWVGAGAALLLSFLRPGWRAYVYVRERLRRIGAEIAVPREDAIDLKRRLASAESELSRLREALDTNHEGSLAQLAAQRLDRLEARCTAGSDAHADLAEHVRLELLRVEREVRNSVAQVLGDAAVVSHVRELVRFFKQA